MPKILVINTKGGVGKSTVAQQVLVPFLYKKSGKPVKLVEIDEMNYDSVALGNSKIMENVLLTTNKLSDLTEHLIEENLVIDTGGNLSGSKSLEYLNESGLLSLIDIAVVPVSDGEQDSVNAIDTMNKLKKYRDDIEVIFAINRVKNIEDERDIRLQFPVWYGTLEVEGYRPEGAKEFFVPDTITVKHSRLFGITVYEMAQQDIEKYKQKLLEATKEKDTEKMRKISDRIYLINKAKDFVNTVFKQVQPYLGG